NGNPYSVSKIGAGRIQTYEAALSPLVFSPSSLSFGMLPANAVSEGTRTVKVTNLSNAPVHAQVAFQASDGLALRCASAIDVPAAGSAALAVAYTVDVTRTANVETQVEGQVMLSLAPQGSAPALALHVPALAVATRSSEIALSVPGSI